MISCIKKPKKKEWIQNRDKQNRDSYKTTPLQNRDITKKIYNTKNL